MAERVAGLNPDVLVWARTRAGLTVGEVASRLKRDTDTITAWEEGTDSPTFRQLEKLAEQVYHRPIALFFFPAPPPEPDPRSEFRTLPAEEIDSLEPDTRYAVREGLAFRESLVQLTGGRNPAARLITRDVRVPSEQPAETLARRVREYLGVDLQTQFSWERTDVALKAWRQVVEDAGVFIFKRSFKQRGISGLCLSDGTFPIILVNNSTAHSRQMFTIFHELGHLLFAVSGITKDDTSFISRLSGTNRTIEVSCNRFAAEFLVPSDSFPWSEFRGRELDTQVRAVATRYRVSREVILRRLLDGGVVDERTYLQKAQQWLEEYLRQRAEKSGGNYYATQATYLGPSYMHLAFSRYYDGSVSVNELADHLGVKAQSIPKLEAFVGSDA